MVLKLHISEDLPDNMVDKLCNILLRSIEIIASITRSAPDVLEVETGELLDPDTIFLLGTTCGNVHGVIMASLCNNITPDNIEDVFL